MERDARILNPASLMLGAVCHSMHLSCQASDYALQTFTFEGVQFLGKPIPLPVSLSELELCENHLRSVFLKMSLPITPIELILIPHGD